MINFKNILKKFLLGVTTIAIGILFLRLILFPRWLDTSLGSLLIFFISTGDFVDPDHEFLYQPDSLEGMTVFGTASYLRKVNEPIWSLVSTGGLFYSIEESTPVSYTHLTLPTKA